MGLNPGEQEITISTGTYVIKQPVGLIGIEQMSIIMDILNVEELFDDVKIVDGKVDTSDSQQLMTKIMKNTNLAVLYKQWATRILKQILVSGPHTFETLPMAASFELFIHSFKSTMEMMDSFQVEPTYSSDVGLSLVRS